MKIKFTNIQWDTDGETTNLPAEVTLDVKNDIDETIEGADVLSDQFGYCVVSFTSERCN